MTSFLTELRANTDNSIPIGVAGYCWGGKHAIVLAHGTTTLPDSTRTLVNCAFAAHPSGLDFPSDIEKISLPFSLAIGDKDVMMGPKMVEESREILEKKKGRVHSEVVVYAGAKHGFAVRGDPGSEREVEQEGQAQDQAVEWFGRWFAEGKREV
jgi:dienelactone hydrolase